MIIKVRTMLRLLFSKLSSVKNHRDHGSFYRSLKLALLRRRYRPATPRPKAKSVRRALLTSRLHHKSAVYAHSRSLFRFYQRRRRLLRRNNSINERIFSLFKAAMRGRRYDFPARNERFRWPARVRQTKVVDPADIWDIICLRTWAFAHVFRAAHSPAGFPKNPTPSQLVMFNFLRTFSKDYYNQEGVFPLAKAPSFLFASSFNVPSPLFSIFWQAPESGLDNNLLLDNFYAHSPTTTIWFSLVQNLTENPSLTSRLFLEDFAVRELEFWTDFFNEVRTEQRLVTDIFIEMFTHPSWFYQQLIRLALAVPFLPSSVRRPLLRNFIRLAKLCKYLWKVDQARLSPEAIYGPLNEIRMNSWFRRQIRYLRDQRFVLSYLPAFLKTASLRRKAKLYSQLRLLAPNVPSRIFQRLFGFSLTLRNLYKSVSVSKRFRRFTIKRLKSKRRRRKQRSCVLNDIVFSRKKKTVTNIHRGGVYVAFNKPFLWNILLLWLVAYFRRMVIGARGHYLSRWLLLATSVFSPPVMSARPWFLSWANVGLGRFLLTHSHYRLACLHWVKAKAKPRRRTYFRRWFTGFFYRNRKTAWRFRSRIPRYYRRFNFIRRLPFSTFRVFWPQSANFIRSRFSRRRNYRRSALAIKRRPSPTSFKLIQPRSTYRVNRTGGSSLTQLTVSRQVSL